MHIFQSTPSVGRATIPIRKRGVESIYFNPRPPWGGRRKLETLTTLPPSISIHALRGEGDISGQAGTDLSPAFQSTPSVGRATGIAFLIAWRSASFQSTPSVGRATLVVNYDDYTDTIFQSTPSVGRATARRSSFRSILTFQSTPSVGRATWMYKCVTNPATDFNPRPPWGGRLVIGINARYLVDFNPRPPWGGRLQKYTNIQYCVCT